VPAFADDVAEDARPDSVPVDDRQYVDEVTLRRNGLGLAGEA
jgi:hypothetical protein